MSARIKILTLVYILILAGIVVLADWQGTNYFAFLRYVPYGDKVGHFCLMGMFSFLLNLVLKAKTISAWRFRYLLGSLIVLVLVTAEEFSQMFIGGRTFDWSDLLADVLGIVIFGELARLIRRKFLAGEFRGMKF